MASNEDNTVIYHRQIDYVCDCSLKIISGISSNNCDSGDRLNIKMLSYQYRVPHVKDKTVSPTVLSLTWESPYLEKTVFILRQIPGPLGNNLDL